MCRASDNVVMSASSSYDKIATDHLLYVVYPLVVGYSIYNLVSLHLMQHTLHILTQSGSVVDVLEVQVVVLLADLLSRGLHLRVWLRHDDPPALH